MPWLMQPLMLLLNLKIIEINKVQIVAVLWSGMRKRSVVTASPSTRISILRQTL